MQDFGHSDYVDVESQNNNSSSNTQRNVIRTNMGWTIGLSWPAIFKGVQEVAENHQWRRVLL